MGGQGECGWREGEVSLAWVGGDMDCDGCMGMDVGEAERIHGECVDVDGRHWEVVTYRGGAWRVDVAEEAMGGRGARWGPFKRLNLLVMIREGGYRLW